MRFDSRPVFDETVIRSPLRFNYFFMICKFEEVCVYLLYFTNVVNVETYSVSLFIEKGYRSNCVTKF